MPTPHKHAAVIKAWADGQEVQVRLNGDGGYLWKDIDRPTFREECEYRVKPSNVVRFCPVFTMPAGTVVVGEGKVCHHSACDSYENEASRYGSLRGVLRIEINPDTLELVSATMEKP